MIPQYLASKKAGNPFQHRGVSPDRFVYQLDGLLQGNPIQSWQTSHTTFIAYITKAFVRLAAVTEGKQAAQRHKTAPEIKASVSYANNTLRHIYR